jgi:phage terminase large subunit GpA-like protein
MTQPVNTHPSGRTLFLAAVARACRPRKRLTVSQWADEHRMLTSKASSEPGPWRTSRVPFAREIMDCLSVTSPVRSVSLMKAGQIAGTEIALNWAGCVMDHAPASMLVVVPTLDVRERWVKQRFDPMVEATPALAKIFDARRRRSGSNSEAIKDYPGGMVIFGGANSPASLASMPIKYVINDEIDRFPWEVGQEGDPLELIRKRQQTFPRRKELNVSTPTIKGASRIDELFMAGDQRYYHVPCPHCGDLLVLKWANLHWTMNPATKRPTAAVYVCEHCGSEIEEHHKTDMLREYGYGGSARWIALNPDALDRSYHINGLYAPLGLGLRWVEMARKWISAQGDNTKLKAFINLDLGEPWEDRTNSISHKTLAERAEPYNLREIPLGCLKLTCGVDVQGDRIEVQLLGHGRGRVTWTVDHLVLPGDPARDEVWDKLTAYLIQPLLNTFGRELRIEATAIDTGGHNTQDVYNYVRRVKELPQAQRPRRVLAIKGSNTPSKPILAGRPQPQDVNWRGRVIKGGILLWMIGTDTAKQLLTDRLKSDANHDAGTRLVRFSNALPEDFYQQLTAEVFDPERNKWVKLRNRRNEALDTWVYATAAAYHPDVRVHAMTARDWQQLEHMLEPADAKPVPAAEPAPAVETDPIVKFRKGPALPVPGPKRGGFTTGWK